MTEAFVSSLQAKEAELLQIDKILEDSELTATKYRMWKEQNEELVHEIEKLTALKASKGEEEEKEEQEEEVQDVPAEDVALETVAKETASSGMAYGLNLSEGEQLVDAELSDVHLDIPQGSLLTPSSPMLELCVGSLQESINQQLSEMMESGEPAENYFYI